MTLLLDLCAGFGGGFVGGLSAWATMVLRRPRGQRLQPVVGTHTDEYVYLKDGQWVPFDPPQYVPDGMHPTQAARDKTRETGLRCDTRRVG